VWEKLHPHIEFAYNRKVNSTTSHTPFEVVYVFNPLTPLDLLPIPILDEVLCKDGLKKHLLLKTCTTTSSAKLKGRYTSMHNTPIRGARH